MDDGTVRRRFWWPNMLFFSPVPVITALLFLCGVSLRSLASTSRSVR
jgi:hypothetical protein